MFFNDISGMSCDYFMKSLLISLDYELIGILCKNVFLCFSSFHPCFFLPFRSISLILIVINDIQSFIDLFFLTLQGLCLYYL